MKLLRNILLHLKRKLPAIGLCVLAFLIFGLYYLGLYDVSFIKRPKDWETNGEALFNYFTPETETTATVDTAVPEAEETKKAETETLLTSPVTDPDEDYDETEIDSDTVLPLSTELAAQGYTPTDAVFDESCKFAQLVTSYGLPKYFTYSTKTYDKTFPVYYDDGTEATTEVRSVTEDRMGIELYMGYIRINDLGTVYLAGPNGTLLTQYDDSVYIPAYTRDKEGRPLFYKTYEYEVEYPTSLGKEDGEGNREWLKTAKLKLEGKEYYYLAADGHTFKKSDYNDATDNRGLYFDYPSYYGVSTTADTKKQLTRYYKETTQVLTVIGKKNKKTTTATPSVLWLFYELKDKKFDPDAETTEYPYVAAYNYSEGYAVVKKDFYWTHKPEDKEKDSVKYTSRELTIIDEKGKQILKSRKGFLSDLNWFANEFYCDPLIPDISALGSYYMDHGLIRIRRQYYDRYIYTEYHQTMIGADEDLLIYPDGTEFYIPPGYDMISYSDGMILLEKDGKYGYMNYTGRWVIQPTLDGASPYLEGVAAMEKNGYWGMVDTEGNTVIPFRYDYVSNASGGIVAAYSEGIGWELYTKMSK